MAKARKVTRLRKPKKAEYLSAKALDILPEERKALIAFVAAPSLGRNIALNGHAHHYNQGDVDDPCAARENECGTAGCVAGFVFAHATIVQGLRSLRDETCADGYLQSSHFWDCHMLDNLYGEGNTEIPLAHAKKVVDQMLKTGEVDWEVDWGVWD